jgi:vacuolar-type H+-ATPase subunit I/STV1
VFILKFHRRGGDGYPKLSFGNSSRRSSSRSGGKGNSDRSKKKVRRKKQEFHKRKQGFAAGEQEAPNIEQTKSKVIAALENLGHQKISSEPGGYDLQSWIKSVNSLLDDFEGKIGTTALPAEYAKKREELSDGTIKPVDFSLLDKEITDLRREADESKERERQNALKLEKIASEKTEINAQLETARRIESERAEQEKRRSFFSKLFGGGRKREEVTMPQQKSSEELSAALQRLEAEETSLRGHSESTPEVHPVGDVATTRLSEIEARISELEATRQEKLQYNQEREALTSELVRIVSHVGETGPGPAAEAAPAESPPKEAAP